ncbi:MAG TPA: DUF3592 domain-containing protein [Candidatus Angelobacter sp.]|jgi:hypothetical protein|nr:DUF3592 domain-containing protein [Candidatus Angelobacter sp.]
MLEFLLNLLLRPVLRRFTGFFHRSDDQIRSVGRQDWPLTTGTIESGVVEPGRNYYTATLRYSYSAAGEFWSGSITRVFFAEQDADDYLAAHRSGTKVAVRYRPDKPEKSVVLMRDQMMASAAGTI